MIVSASSGLPESSSCRLAGQESADALTPLLALSITFFKALTLRATESALPSIASS